MKEELVFKGFEHANAKRKEKVERGKSKDLTLITDLFNLE